MVLYTQIDIYLYLQDLEEEFAEKYFTIDLIHHWHLRDYEEPRVEQIHSGDLPDEGVEDTKREDLTKPVVDYYFINYWYKLASWQEIFLFAEDLYFADPGNYIRRFWKSVRKMEFIEVLAILI